MVKRCVPCSLPDRCRYRKAIAIATEIADALAKAHETGLVHRDLKPENLMVAHDGNAKILDFGLAKLRDQLSRFGAPDPGRAHSPTLERSWEPSVICRRNRPTVTTVDFRSDQFSFGAVLYEMVNGHPAFQGRGKAEIMAAIRP